MSCFAWLNRREINTAFTVTAAAFFCEQISVNKPANVKYGCCKQYGYNDYLDVHVTNLIHFIYIRIDG